MIFVLHLNNLSLTMSIFMSAKKKGRIFSAWKVCFRSLFFLPVYCSLKTLCCCFLTFINLIPMKKSIFLHIKNNLYSFFVFVCFENIIFAQHNQAHYCFSIHVLYYLFSQYFITLCVFLSLHNAIFLIDFRLLLGENSLFAIHYI